MMHDAPGADEVAGVVRRTQRLDDHSLVAVGGMGEFTIANVDADVRNTVFVSVLEKHQIACFKIADGLAVLILFRSSSRKGDSSSAA